jgi:Uma2 family endonuclease
MGEHRSTRLAYDRGTLEIKLPSKLHELINRLLERIITTLTEELGMNVLSLGSTTFDSEAVEQGVEPDSCFYIQNADRVNPEDNAPPKDFPPDLVVEVDITSSSRSRLNIYKSMGVPEIWRYSRQGLAILQLQQGDYVECEYSSTFALLSAEILENFLERGRQSKNHNSLINELRMWLRNQNNML